jgi:hypothetical protein
MAGSDRGDTSGRPSPAERFGEILGTVFTRAERTLKRSSSDVPSNGAPAVTDVKSETQDLRTIGDEDVSRSSAFASLTSAWSDPNRRQWAFVGAAALALLLVAIFLLPSASTRLGIPAAPTADSAAPPSAGAPAPAEQPAGQPTAVPPADTPPAATPAAESSGGTRQLLLDALPLLLGLFWLLSAWLVDAEARRAFVVKEPWGDRRTVAYTMLAVGCVFPLILAGLIFSAWGFVTFVLAVAGRQNPIAGLQAGAIILMIGAGFLVLRGLIARWLDTRRG